MNALLRLLGQIALLRKDPSVLPASYAWVLVFAVGYFVANVLMARVDNTDRILARTAFDLALTVAFFWLLLAVMRRAHRFPQAISAVFGIYLLFAPVMIGLLLLRGPSQVNYGIWVLTTAGSTIVMIWYLLAVGHVLRAALDTGLVTGFAIAVTWAIASVVLAQSLFGAAA
jgi:hypothetical protein